MLHPQYIRDRYICVNAYGGARGVHAGERTDQGLLEPRLLESGFNSAFNVRDAVGEELHELLALAALHLAELRPIGGERFSAEAPGEGEVRSWQIYSAPA